MLIFMVFRKKLMLFACSYTQFKASVLTTDDSEMYDQGFPNSGFQDYDDHSASDLDKDEAL